MKISPLAMALMFGLIVAAGTANAASVTLTVTNPLAVRQTDLPVVVKMADLRRAAPAFTSKGFVLTTKGSLTAIPAQADDLDGDGTPDEIAFTLDLTPNEHRTLLLTDQGPAAAPAFPQRAHAMFARKYEGMGWESDRVAWRLYFDKRNAIDLYGKHQHTLSLDYYAKPRVVYHNESPYGRDIFKNGDAIGLGSIAAYVGGKSAKVSDVTSRTWTVLADGPVRAIADLHYAGWKVGGKSVDLTSRLTIWAGQHWFEHSVLVKNGEGLTLVTGLPLKPNVQVLPMPSNSAFSLATWGQQVLREGATATEAMPNRLMGLAVILPVAGTDTEKILPDPLDTLIPVPLSPAGEAHFYVLAAWDGEAPETVPDGDPALSLPGAIASADAWKNYVAAVTRAVLAPAQVQIQTKGTSQ